MNSWLFFSQCLYIISTHEAGSTLWWAVIKQIITQQQNDRLESEKKHKSSVLLSHYCFNIPKILCRGRSILSMILSQLNLNCLLLSHTVVGFKKV